MTTNTGRHLGRATSWLLLLTLVILAFATTASTLAAGVGLKSLQVELWSEYDRPGMLVIYEAQLSPDTPSPATVEFHIPAEAGKPHAVAVGRTFDKLDYEDFAVVPGTPYETVVITTTQPVLRVEYYMPLQQEGQTRRYNFTWPGDYEVDSFRFRVLRPVDTTQMTLDPDLGPTTAASDGLTYYEKTIGSLAEGEEQAMHLSYVKTSDRLTAESIPATGSTAGSNSELSPWLVLAGLVFGLSLAGLVVWVIRNRRSEPVRARPEGSGTSGKRTATPAHSPVATRRTERLAATGSDVCPQCGTPRRSGDQFCRQCGTRF